MRYSLLTLAATALLASAGAATAQQPAAAKLQVGEWTGQVTPPGAETTNVTYDIAYAGDTLKITIRAGEHGTFATTDVKFEGSELTFRFRPGPEVTCVLKKQMESFAGVCTGDDGMAATMDLSPPKKEAAKS